MFFIGDNVSDQNQEVSSSIPGRLNSFKLQSLSDSSRMEYRHGVPSGFNTKMLLLKPGERKIWEMPKERFDYLNRSLSDLNVSAEEGLGQYALLFWRLNRITCPDGVLIGFTGKKDGIKKPVPFEKNEDVEIHIGFVYRAEKKAVDICFLVLNGKKASVEVEEPYSSESTLFLSTPDKKLNRELKLGTIQKQKVMVAENDSIEWIVPWEAVQRLITNKDRALIQQSGGVFHLEWESGGNRSKPLPIMFDEPLTDTMHKPDNVQ